ncbi:GumC family protein [Novosphingobium beihaiensis]|uniref:Lipopolysaccharide biosynthesis protein n=1 Tax=Novosphingobium beihaiensis TaxID=2930389 RepID=A0ABT0BVM1_9SPHN|nr:hypothetical protein [Novosphingobium beihaiensis]MCJ2188851.1 hypothetical protein [Novosphingobium beihaiensis]
MIQVFPDQPPRRLVRLWWLIRDGMPSLGRYRRYAMVVLPSLIGVWLVVAAYLLFAPTSYTSNMTLILPGSGAGGSINLESIGQASAQTNSAFASSTLSPTENYKRLLMADVTLKRAAQIAEEGDDPLSTPAIRLVDQTNLIAVSMSGPTAQQAQARLEAVREAFLKGLENLREDEAAKREAADRDQIAELERKVQQTQRRLLEFQGDTGLATLDQFNQRINVLDGLHAKQRDTRSDLERERAAASRLAASLRVTPEEAGRAMVLKADPIFQSLLARYAAISVNHTESSATLGARHMTVAELDAEQNSLRASMVRRGQALTGLGAKTLLNFADLSVSEGRARMFESLVAADSASAGAAGALAEVDRQISHQTKEAHELVRQASALADLLRDHRVAEAVFSSALARLDTNKSDPFASYPLVQTLEQPSLPKKPSSPSALLAIAGGVATTLFIIMGFALLWVRQPIIRKILPKG